MQGAIFFFGKTCVGVRWFFIGMCEGEKMGIAKKSNGLPLSPSPSLEIAARIRNGPSEGKELDLPHVFRIYGYF